MTDYQKFIVKYSDPFINRSVYDADPLNKSDILWGIIKTKTIGGMIVKTWNKLLADFKKEKMELYFHTQEPNTLYIEFNHIIDNMGVKMIDTINELKKMIPISDDNSIIFSLNKEIQLLNEKIIKLESNINARQDNQSTIKQLQSQIEITEQNLTAIKETINQYQLNTQLLEKTKIKLCNLELENKSLKLKTAQTATLLISSRINTFEAGDFDSTEKIYSSEYNFYLDIQGFKDYEQKLKNIIKLNRELTHDNSVLKLKFEELLSKYKILMKEEKTNYTKIKQEFQDILYNLDKDKKIC